MTGENRRANIAIALERGKESLESAEILLGAGKYADAVSRAYYAAFHHASALLLMTGQQARRHSFDPESSMLLRLAPTLTSSR